MRTWDERQAEAYSKKVEKLTPIVRQQLEDLDTAIRMRDFYNDKLKQSAKVERDLRNPEYIRSLLKPGGDDVRG